MRPSGMLKLVVAVAVLGLIVAPGAGASVAGKAGINADTVDGFHAVGCGTHLVNRGKVLVATCTNGRLPSNIIAIAPNSKKLSGKTLAQVVATAEADLNCTGCVQAVEIADGSIDPGKLQAAAPSAGQVLKFDGSGFSWQADQDTTYNAGTGLSLAGTTFSVNPSVIQNRVTGTCPVGGVRSILQDGTVQCEVEPRSVVGPTAITSFPGGASSFPNAFPSITVGLDGLPIFSWFDGANTDINVTHCTDMACTIGTTTLVEGTVASNEGDTSIILGSGGLAGIAYYAGTELRFKQCLNVTCTSLSTAAVMDGVGATDAGAAPSLGIATDGNPIISYFSVTSASLKLVHCTSPSCVTKDVPRTIDNTGDATTGVTGEFSSLTIGSDGFPKVAYYSRSGQVTTALRLVLCNNTACLDPAGAHIGFTVTTPDNTADDGQFVSATTGSDGMVVMSYREIATNVLKVAHCNDQACSAPTIQTVDATASVGESTSITVGQYGFPIVTYRDLSNTALKLAYCFTLTCTGKVLQTIDNSGDVGTDTSVTLGVDGYPVIAYFNPGTDDVVVARCTSPWCTSNYRRR